MFKTIKNELNKEHSGDMAIEYLIVVVMTAAIFYTAWKIMGPTIKNDCIKIANKITNNNDDSLNISGFH